MRKWILGGIIILAFLLRVVALDRLPVGFTPDEASFGYDAYCLLLTGKDQWGHKFPLVLESFGDFKPPLYSYILIPFVWLLGLSKAAVRLPNALFGTAAVYATYLLAKELKKFIEDTRNSKLEILAALLLAISPWHVMLSRGAFEANLTTFFLPLGIYFFIKGIKNHSQFKWSAVLFGVNLFSYHSAKLVTPLLVIILVFLFRKELRQVKLNNLILPFIIFIIFIAITAYTFTGGAGSRAQEINIFKGTFDSAVLERYSAIVAGVPSGLARLLHNKFQVGLRRFISTYLLYFSPQYMFTNGPAEATYGMIPGRGMLYWFEMPFIFGFFAALLKSKRKRVFLFLIGWLLVAPIPAALTTGPGYSGNRSAIMMPAVQIALSYGIVEFLSFIKIHAPQKYLRYLVSGYVIVSALFFISFTEDYFMHSPKKTAKSMLHGNLETAQWLSKNTKDAIQVIVSRGLSEPQMYIAFANKWSPVDYQKQTKNWDYKEAGVNWVDQIPEYRLGNYVFKSVHLKEYQNQANTLLVARLEDFPKGVVPAKTFYYPNGDISIVVIDPLTQAYAKAD